MAYARTILVAYILTRNPVASQEDTGARIALKHYGRWSRRADAEREAGTMALERFLWNTRPSMPIYGLVALKPYMSAQGSEQYGCPVPSSTTRLLIYTRVRTAARAGHVLHTRCP